MVKKNKLLIGCLALLLVLSVGYALFSETIEINGTATAKGSFDITPSCSTVIPDYVLQEISDTEGGHKNATCTASGNTITSDVTLEYPSAFKLFYTEYKNTGSINAVAKFMQSGDNFADMVNMTGSINLYKKSDDSLFKTTMEFDENYIQFMPAKYYVKKADGTILHTKSELSSNNKVYMDSDGYYYIEIEPNESLIFVYELFWDEDAEQTDYYSKINFKLDINFMQKPDSIELKTDGSAPEFCQNWC